MRKLSAKPRGFTLVELLIVCAVAGVLVTVAWPSLRPSWLQAGRADAVQALTTLQQRQARHHAQHGLYSLDGGSSTSPQGLYAVTVDVIRAEGYSASATALPGSRQAADGDCARLTVSIERGFASLGPSARCWNQ